MLVYNKYLKELGYKKDDFHFKKEDSRYNLDKKCGVVQAQTWNMDNTIILELYTYLRYFQDHLEDKFLPGPFSSIYGGKDRTEEWHKVVQDIVDGLKAYNEWQNDWMSIDEKETAERKAKFDKAWKLLGEYLGCFWW